MAQNNEILDAIVRVTEACAGLSTDDTVETLGLAWLMWAANARTQHLGVPGGFPAERERQAQWLEKMAAIIRLDEPDLEGERLFQEGDLNGFVDHVKKRIQEGGS